MPPKRPLKDRFFDKIRYNPSVIRTYTPKGGGPSTTVIRGCMEWTASTISGYGAIGEGSKVLYAHRVRYGLETGLEIPADGSYHGMCVCHRCDNRRCVTISHLYIGRQGDNTKERDEKGRTTKGEEHGLAIVSDDVKNKVIEAYATGAFSQRELAEEVGVCPKTVSNWVRGVTRA